MKLNCKPRMLQTEIPGEKNAQIIMTFGIKAYDVLSKLIEFVSSI